jgi:hypothetical protein
VEYVGEAATLDANMCEVAAAIHDIRSAVEIIVAFARARKRAK